MKYFKLARLLKCSKTDIMGKERNNDIKQSHLHKNVMNLMTCTINIFKYVKWIGDEVELIFP